MCGSMFAGTEEAPGETIIYNGRKFKTYRGMGSIDAMKAGSTDRYFQDSNAATNKLVPEGIVGRVPFKGALNETVYQLIGGIRSGMGYCGAKDLATLRSARFIRVTASGVIENHPHDITITRETPNYTRGERKYGVALEMLLKNGNFQQHDFDITDQVLRQPHGGVIVVSGIEIDEDRDDSGGGFQVGVDGWGDEVNVPLPI